MPHQWEDPFVYTCTYPDCTTSFDTLAGRQKHVRKNHRSQGHGNSTLVTNSKELSVTPSELAVLGVFLLGH